MLFENPFVQNPSLLVGTAILLPILISLRFYPSIIELVHFKNLMDEPVERSSHQRKTPTLGGVVAFIAFSLSLVIMAILGQLNGQSLLYLLTILAATLILMTSGVKDDLMGISPWKKLSIQTFSAALVVIFTDLRINNFHGLFGIEQLPYIISVILTIFVFLVVINAFNLIDGIDGLAGTIGVVCSLTFGTLFYLNQQPLMILTSFTLVGTLIGFLCFNTSRKRKIFMGDSGSMFIGFLLVYQAVSFLAFEATNHTQHYFKEAPILVVATLSYPLLDTLRVFVIRVKQKRSPFSADQNHIHHKLLKLGFPHIQASLIIGLLNVLVIFAAILLRGLNINLQLMLLLLSIPLIYGTPWLLSNKNDKLKLSLPWLSKR